MVGKEIKAIAIAIVASLVGIILLVIVADDDQCRPAAGFYSTTSVPSGSYAMPEAVPPGRLTSGFGPRWGSMHNGIDLATSPGAPIYAFADGVVALSGPASGFGNWIVIDHTIDGKTVSTVYGHMFSQDLLVTAGQVVRAGQQIAREGYNGQVSPPGPGGSHLHFEIHDGGLSGPPIDPQPWLNGAVTPTEGGSFDIDIDAPTTGLEEGQPLPPLPPSVGSEQNFQRDAIKLARAVHAAFPQVRTIGGWRPFDPFPDHPSGRAVDVMIPNYETSQGQALGTQIKDWLVANRVELNIDYLIWQQTYIPVSGQANRMEDRGSPTQNHFDHVHITTTGGGHPSGSETYTMETINAGGTGYSLGTGCASGLTGGELAPGAVPPELEPWLRRAGSLCSGVTPALLAAQMEAESGFQPGLASPVGAQGYAQFMPGTWATIGADVDGSGTPIGPPGSGDPNDPGDAAMAQGRYMCELYSQMDAAQKQGRVSGDLVELTLAAYNAGPGNVYSYGGVPPFVETTSYIQRITINISRYA